jgi:hypothetical protein
MLIVKNKSGITKTWCGQEIENDSSYQIKSSEQTRWANDEDFLSDIVSNYAVINDGYNDIHSGAAINLLKQIPIYPGTYLASDYKDLFYKKVAALSDELSTGIIIPNSEKVGLYRFRANGSDPSAYVVLVWDLNGDTEKIFVSTKGDVDLFFDVNNEAYQITGNGTKKFNILLINNGVTESPHIGGDVDLMKV